MFLLPKGHSCKRIYPYYLIMQEQNNFLKTERKGAFRHRILTKLILKEVGEMHLNGTN